VIGGRDVTTCRRSPRYRDVFQSYALFPHMTVFENIAFGMRIRRQAKSEITCKSAASPTGCESTRCLTGCRRLFPADSGSASRSLARSCGPGVFLMDGRCRTLTPSGYRSAKLPDKMHQEIGVTTVYVTHDQSEAMTWDTVS